MSEEKPKPKPKVTYNVGTVGAFHRGKKYKVWSKISIPADERPANGWYKYEADGKLGEMIENAAAKAVGAPPGEQADSGIIPGVVESKDQETMRGMAKARPQLAGEKKPRASDS